MLCSRPPRSEAFPSSPPEILASDEERPQWYIRVEHRDRETQSHSLIASMIQERTAASGSHSMLPRLCMKISHNEQREAATDRNELFICSSRIYFMPHRDVYIQDVIK